MARKGEGPATFVPLQNHPLHRGMVDSGYIRPAPCEFPKMCYHAAGMVKIVQNRQEQDDLGPTWTETPPRRSGDWRAKLNEMFTKSGFRVYQHHLEFLQSAGVQAGTLQDCAQFLDSLDSAQQEQFFREAEEVAQPEQPTKEESEKKSKKKAA